MHRELTLLTHERLAVLVILLGAATAYSLLIGNLYLGGIVQRIPVAVCDLDDSPISRELIRAVADADQYDFRQTLSDDAEAVKLLERGEIAAVLIIPEDFSKKFYRSESVNMAFLQDGSNTLQADYASAPMQLICAAFNGCLYVAAFLLSDYIWSEIGMPQIIRWISMLQPVHYILTDFRSLGLTGVAPQINQHAAILFAIGSVSFILLYEFLFFDERPSVTSEIF